MGMTGDRRLALVSEQLGYVAQLLNTADRYGLDLDRMIRLDGALHRLEVEVTAWRGALRPAVASGAVVEDAIARAIVDLDTGTTP